MTERKERLEKILSGDFIEFTAWFADGSTASLSEFDGITSEDEAQKRALRISIMEGRGSVVKLFRSSTRRTVDRKKGTSSTTVTDDFYGKT